MTKLQTLLLLFLTVGAWAQETEKKKKSAPAVEAFKETRIINGHSVDMIGQGDLNLIISHRFGRLSGGARELFGLDQATMRIGLDYGVSSDFAIGFGRSTFNKVYDGYLKYRVFRQGDRMPISLVAFTSIAINTTEFSEADKLNKESKHRNYYTYQLLLARKFSDRISVQLMPSVVHRNLVATRAEENTVYALGSAAKIQLSKTIALNLEHYYVPDGQLADNFKNSFGVGLDFETNGHTFQLSFTNSLGLNAQSFITETTDDFWKNQIHFGFNISRVFRVKGKKTW